MVFLFAILVWNKSGIEKNRQNLMVFTIQGEAAPNAPQLKKIAGWKPPPTLRLPSFNFETASSPFGPINVGGHLLMGDRRWRGLED